MMMKKRGLSDVVTVTLIILLAVAAVVIVWAFVRSTIEEAGKDIKVDCIKTNLKVLSCGVASTPAVETTPIVIESAAGGLKVDSVRFVYYNSAGDTTSINTVNTNCVNIDPLERRTCTITTPPAATFVKVDVVKVIGDQVCPPSGIVVNCV